MGRFDAVFFDSGGTLFENTGMREANGWQARGERLAAALQAWGCRVDSDDLEAARLDLEARLPRDQPATFTHYTLIQALAERLNLELSPEELACVTDTYSGPRFRSWLFAGTHEMLEQLTASGMYLGLIANTHWPGWTMERAFTGVGLLQFFNVRLYSGDLGVAKPDVAIFREAERRANVSAGPRLLYVGNDLRCDVEGAGAAGWSTAFRVSEQHPDSGGQADLDFAHWNDLVRFVLE